MEAVYNVIETLASNDKSSIKILLLGIGGGSDIVVSHAIAQCVSAWVTKNKIDVTLVLGNSKGSLTPGRLPLVIGDLNSQLTPCVSGSGLYTLVADDQVEQTLTSTSEVNGTLQLEQFVAGTYYPEQGVLVCVADELTNQSAKAMEGMGFDLIIAEDTGGDSLVKGVEKTNRDAEILKLLRSVKNTRLVHVVVSPGMDGESDEAEMGAALLRLEKTHIVETGSVADLVPHLREWVPRLPANKTPRLILRMLETWEKKDPDQTYIVERYHNQTKTIRCTQLAKVYAVQYKQ